jgi:hypothetical protein
LFEFQMLAPLFGTARAIIPPNHPSWKIRLGNANVMRV